MTSAWPDVPAATSPGLKVRDQLDYVIWVSSAMEPLGFHGGSELETWRTRTHRAYAALVDSMTPGHGDPLPPDVPPSVQPGVWPDVASAGIPGMTVRHQLAVVRLVATETRGNRGFPHAPADVLAWCGRVQSAYDALDHGTALTLPPEARSEPPPPPPVAKKRAAAKASPAARRASGAAVPPAAKAARATTKKPAAAKKSNGKKKG